MKRIFRYFITILLVLLLALPLASCGKKQPAASETEQLQSIPDATESTAEESEPAAAESGSDAEESDPGGLLSMPMDPTETPEITETPAPTETPEITETPAPEPEPEEAEQHVVEDGEYSSKEEVAEYIHLFGHLPGNYISKNKAEDLGWQSNKGNLWKVAPGKSIGGGRFGNYEGLLPDKKGRKYYECDIDFDGGYRNSKRIVYSNDGLIYYTEDHYNTFELLYE